MSNILNIVKKAIFGALAILVSLIIINAGLELIGGFLPIVPSFVSRPIGTVKALFAKKTTAAA